MGDNETTPEERNKAAVKRRSPAPCSACGQRPKGRGGMYGDFSEYEVRALVADYCRAVTLGLAGWGMPFKVWVEMQGIARHDGMHRLIRLPNEQEEARDE